MKKKSAAAPKRSRQKRAVRATTSPPLAKISQASPTEFRSESSDIAASQKNSGRNCAHARVLLVVPDGKDRSLAVAALKRAGIPGQVCITLDEVAQSLSESTDAILLAEESLVQSDAPLLLKALRAQPAWSDIPIVILTTAGRQTEGDAFMSETFSRDGNVTLLPRPFHAATLTSTLQVATRARRRQRELRDLFEQHETVLASISDAFSALDRNWRYTYANDRAADLAGLPKEKMLGRLIWEISPQAVGGEFYKRCHRAMESRQADQFQIFEASLGRWLETRIYPTKDGIVIFGADVTEGKKQTALMQESDIKLKESEGRLRLATEAAGIGTFDYYPQTRELVWSERCNQLFGLMPGTKVTYETYIAGVHPEDRHIVHETVQRVMHPGGSDHYDIEYRTIGLCDGKERWVAEKGRAVLDSSGRATRFIGTILDITERRNSEIALELAKQEAEEANRAKDQFLAMLSHELRTPLTPVLMTIASLRREPDLSDQLRGDLEMLQRNIQLEALLIDDLLDLTRIRHGKLELDYDAVDLHTLVEHALSISAGDIVEKQLTVTPQLVASEHHAWADATRLQQVFWNLIKNAVKFTSVGGRIDIRSRNDDEHHAIVEIADDGMGIEPEMQTRIFDAFEQGGREVTSRHGGLGLGLAISKKVIDLHGGTIAVTSAGRGHGAIFTVRLQAMETSLLEGPTYFLERDAADSARMEILLVEDHADTAQVLRRVLERAGYNVGHVRSVADARELAALRSFDIVVSDVGLPDGSGLELMQHLRETYGLRGVALSGFGMDEDVAASKAAGFAEHLTKPIDCERLRDAIKRLTNGRHKVPATKAS